MLDNIFGHYLGTENNASSQCERRDFVRIVRTLHHTAGKLHL